MADDCCDTPCHHDVCLMEAALHERGVCTEHDHIVVGVYCPLVVCASEGIGISLASYPYATEGTP